jgi:hypothetical protein
MNTKAAVKSAPKKRIRNRKPAAAPAAEKTAVVNIKVATEGLDELKDCVQKVHGAADVLLTAVEAAKELEARPNPGQKRLHRRVVVAIYDGEGTRLSYGSHDLKASETLEIGVEGDAVRILTKGSRARGFRLSRPPLWGRRARGK